MDEGGSKSEASLCLRKLCEGNLEGGLLYWRPWRIYKKGSGDEHLSP
jgi:hypothetical protein